MSNTNNRREHGYNHEKSVVKFFNKSGWFARRLGGSSTGLPDVVCNFSKPKETNFPDESITIIDREGWLYSMECKYTTSNYTYVDNDQLIRCDEIVKGYDLYQGHIVLAFRFSRVGPRDPKTKKNAKRKQKDYYFMFNSIENIDNIKNIRCTYDGSLSIVRYDKDIPVVADYETFKKIGSLVERFYDLVLS